MPEFDVAAAQKKVETALQNMPALGGWVDNSSVWSHCSAGVRNGGCGTQMRIASEHNWGQDQAADKMIAIFDLRNQALDFQPQSHDGGAKAMAICSETFRVAPGTNPPTPNEVPSSNAIDPRTGKPFETTYDAEEANYRLTLNVGYQGNAFAPYAASQGAEAARKFLANPTGPWSQVNPTVLTFVLMEGLDTVENPYGAEMYYGMTTEQEVLDLQKRLAQGGPSVR